VSAALRAVAEAAARAGGAVIQEALAQRDGAQPYRAKDAEGIDLLTTVDLAAEAAVRASLEERSPGVPVLAEEGGGAASASTRWIVDPIDGTTNFVHGFPAFCTSVALERDGVLVAGCVYDPVRDHAYAAHRGGGATCNGRPLRVSETPTLGQSLVLTGFAYDRRERPDFYLRYVREMLVQAQGIRRAGAAALDFCHIAAGRADGYWEFHLSPWDVAAGILLVQEAGGRVTTLAQHPVRLDQPEILCTNGHIHAEMAAALTRLVESRDA